MVATFYIIIFRLFTLSRRCCPNINFPTTTYRSHHFHVRLNKKILVTTVYICIMNAFSFDGCVMAEERKKLIYGAHKLDVDKHPMVKTISSLSLSESQM